jgi:hypothetical protein
MVRLEEESRKRKAERRKPSAKKGVARAGFEISGFCFSIFYFVGELVAAAASQAGGVGVFFAAGAGQVKLGEAALAEFVAGQGALVMEFEGGEVGGSMPFGGFRLRGVGFSRGEFPCR